MAIVPGVPGVPTFVLSGIRFLGGGPLHSLFPKHVRIEAGPKQSGTPPRNKRRQQKRSPTTENRRVFRNFRSLNLEQTRFRAGPKVVVTFAAYHRKQKKRDGHEPSLVQKMITTISCTSIFLFLFLFMIPHGASYEHAVVLCWIA